ISKETVNGVRINGVNTAGQTSISTVEGNGVTAVKTSAGYVWRTKITDLNNVSKDNNGSWISKRVKLIDPKGILSGCSRKMTENKALLTDYQDIDGGFVAFGESTKCGIKREYSVARTPQQNGVAERKNKTLIEAARTMLADSLLPAIFWAKAVNAACYFRNKANLMGRLKKGFLVGYFVNSKAFRVFNTQTRKVEENLFKKGDGYHAVPSPLSGNYMPPLANLSFVRLDDSVYRPTANKVIASISKGEPSAIKTSNISVKMPKVNSVRTNGVTIKIGLVMMRIHWWTHKIAMKK
nr:ribonuclease H-like domain-containing protein [Tanacetum cinerariifolium]